MTNANPGSWMMVAGLAFMLLGVAAGVRSGELGLLLGLAGVLVGANFIAIGVRRMAEEPLTSIRPAAFLRRNIDVVGLILCTSAITAVAGGEAGPVLCFAMFALFLLGLCFIIVHVLGDE